MNDGLSGILTQPYHGAKKGGGSGFVKGVGKGIASVIAKAGGDESVGFECLGSNRVRGVKKNWD